MLVALGLGPVTLALAAQPLRAQQAEAVPAEEDVADAGDPPPVLPAVPEPAPVPRSLDDLIPPEAVSDPESWARGDFAEPALVEPIPAPSLDDPFLAEFGTPELADDPALAAFPADALDSFALEVPDPLPPDPEVEALATLAEPVLGEIPDLAEVRISDTLTLAFPAAEGSFPERDEFIARFRELSTIRELDDGEEAVAQVAARARADEELLGNILRTYGYYGGEVVRQLSGGRRARENGEEAAEDVATEPSVRFDILPGTRYAFGRIDFGALRRMPPADADPLVAAFAIRSGDPLYADRILDREIDLRVALGETGFPFAEVAEPQLLIDHARTEGDLTLAVEPGGKYAFGEVVSSDPDFLSGRHLARIARFDPGDIYQQSLETDLRRAILATGLVSSVTVTPRETAPPAAGEPGRVALDVAFDRAPLRTIAGAIGYGTEDGIKVEGRWEHRNLFPPEGALRLRGILGTREQLASIGFRRNNFRGRDKVLTVDLFASDIVTEAVDARSVGTRATFERISNFLFQKELSWQLGGELLYTDERNRTVRGAPGIPLPRRTFLIGGVFGSVTLDESDDLLDPSSGWRTTLFLAPEVSRSEGAQSTYVRAQLDASYYLPAGSTVLAGRVRAATIQGAGIDNVAPSRRLYAGGGGSVRGYGFQGVGPRNDRGEATGGGSLVEVSVEARIETGLFDGAVEIVPFFDAGTVSLGSTPDFRFIRYGAGVGLRYKTSFGPIRIDVATPLNPGEFDAPVVVYVSLGQAF